MSTPPRPTPGVLDGVHVLEVTLLPVGQYAGKLLADLGADVVRVEAPAGDAVRAHPPFAHDEPGPERGLRWWQFHSGKRSLGLDVWSRDGAALLRELAGRADVVLCSGRPAELESLGAPWAGETAEGASVITTVTPYGWTGPKRDLPAPDLVAQADGGILQISGFPQERPMQIGGRIAETHASLHGVVGTLMALWGVRAGGPPQHVDVSMQESVAAAVQPDINFWDLQEQVRAREALGSIRPGAGIYQAADGWVGVHTLPWHFDKVIAWLDGHGMAAELTDPEWADPAFRLANGPRLNAIFADFFRTLDKMTLADEGQAHRALVFPVLDATEVARDPQVRARGWLQGVRQAGVGCEVEHPGPPFRLSERPWQLRRGAPTVGADTASVLGELGLSGEELAALAAAGVVA